MCLCEGEVIAASYFVAGTDDLFDDDAICENQHFGDGGEEHASSLHHAHPITEHAAATIGLAWLGATRVCQLRYSCSYNTHTHTPKHIVLYTTLLCYEEFELFYNEDLQLIYNSHNVL